MLECVAYLLARNAIDVIPNIRSEVSRCAFHLHAKLGRVRVAFDFTAPDAISELEP